jgi:hypothetical protein
MMSLYCRGILIQHPCLGKKPGPETFLHTIARSSLEADFCSRGLPQCLQFRKFFFGQPPLHQTDSVNVAQVCICVPVMDGRDKRDTPAHPFLHLTDGQTRNVL